MFGVIPRKETAKVGYPMNKLRNEFKALYDRFFGGWPVLFEPYIEPECSWGLETEDAEKEFIVRAELRGFETDEVDVEMHDGGLLIRAERKTPGKEKNPEEFARYRYERIVKLPVPTIPEKAEAFYRNGVLEVHLPKAEEPAGKRIPVK